MSSDTFTGLLLLFKSVVGVNTNAFQFHQKSIDLKNDCHLFVQHYYLLLKFVKVLLPPKSEFISCKKLRFFISVHIQLIVENSYLQIDNYQLENH